MNDGAGRRTIGDILLALGFVSEEALADAAVEQARTAQPLGQILVEQGVITRLELASALAEQWSDPDASITLLPRLTPQPAPVTVSAAGDRDSWLQDAVADLARKVQTIQSREGFDEQVADLSLQLEKTLARTKHLETTMATLAEHLDGVASGVDEAFAAVTAGTADLVLEVARVDSCVVELATRPSEPPPSDPVLSQRLDRVEALAAERAPRADLEDQAEMLAGLRTALTELEARPLEHPDLEPRLAQIEPRLAQIEARLAQLASGKAAVEALADRVETSASSHESLVVSVEALGHRLQELSARRDRDSDIAPRLDALEADLLAETAAVGSLRDAVAAQARAASPAAARLDELALALDTTRGEIVALQSLGPSHSVITERVETLAAQIEQLTLAQAGSDGLAARLDGVEARHATDEDTLDVLVRAIDRIREDVTNARAPASSDGAVTDETLARIDERLNSLESIGVRVEELGVAIEAAAPGNDTRIPYALRQEIELRIENLSRRLDEKLAAIGGSALGAPERTDTKDEELERIRMAVERVGLHIGEHDRALAELMRSKAVTQRLDELAARVDELARAGTAGGPAGSGGGASDVTGDMRALLLRIEETETSSQADREKLMSKLERMASSIDWRLQRLETDETE